MAAWTHRICDACWKIKHPGESPAREKDSPSGQCCFCNRKTRSGIFIRYDARKLQCGKRHNAKGELI